MGANQNKEPRITAVAATFDGVTIDLGSVPVHIDNIHVEGLDRTKIDYVTDCFNGLVNVRTFNEMVFKAKEVQRRLESLGCFKNVGIIIDTSKGRSARKDGYEIIYNVQEISRFVGGISTMVGSNEGAITIEGRLPNLAGRGEKINIEHTIGSNSNNRTLLSFSKPFRGAWDIGFTTTLFHHKNQSPWSSFTMSSSGAVADLYFKSAPRVKHSLQWEGVWRQLEASGRNTSLPVREQSGHSFKSAIRHVLTVDKRNVPIFPSSGVLLKLVHECAGLGGDVAFLKHDSELQLNIPLPYELVLQGSARLGVLKSLGSRVVTPNISDLFFLGGPQTLRGFEMKSLGSRSGNDALGGKAYWASALHLYSPLPLNVGRGAFGDFLRLHFFLNAGNISDSSSLNGEDFAKSFQAFWSNFRAAYGVGLAMRLGQAARIEINYCWPFKYLDGDKLAKGVQFGLGIEFL